LRSMHQRRVGRKRKGHQRKSSLQLQSHPKDLIKPLITSALRPSSVECGWRKGRVEEKRRQLLWPNFLFEDIAEKERRKNAPPFMYGIHACRQGPLWERTLCKVRVGLLASKSNMRQSSHHARKKRKGTDGTTDGPSSMGAHPISRLRFRPSRETKKKRLWFPAPRHASLSL